MPEPGNDPGDDFTIAMLTDQHMGTGSSIAEQHHQLLGMPKGENNVPSFLIQGIDRFVPASLIAHRACDASNRSRCNRGQQREFHPLFCPLLQILPTLSTQHSAPHVVRHWLHLEIAWHADGDRRPSAEAVHHESPFQQ